MLLIKKVTVRIAHLPFNFISLYLFVLKFTMNLKDVNSMYIVWFYCNLKLFDKKSDVRFDYVLSDSA